MAMASPSEMGRHGGRPALDPEPGIEAPQMTPDRVHRDPKGLGDVDIAFAGRQQLEDLGLPNPHAIDPPSPVHTGGDPGSRGIHPRAERVHDLEQRGFGIDPEGTTPSISSFVSRGGHADHPALETSDQGLQRRQPLGPGIHDEKRLRAQDELIQLLTLSPGERGEAIQGEGLTGDIGQEFDRGPQGDLESGVRDDEKAGLTRGSCRLRTPSGSGQSLGDLSPHSGRAGRPASWKSLGLHGHRPDFERHATLRWVRCSDRSMGGRTPDDIPSTMA